jgi:hypothetical protein
MPRRFFSLEAILMIEPPKRHSTPLRAAGSYQVICLDASPPPIQSGCACRGDGGLAHIGCLVEAAASQQAHRGDAVWQQCQTCKQEFTGAMQMGLAEAWRLRVAGQGSGERRTACSGGQSGARSLLGQGKGVEVEQLLRTLFEVEMRVLGAEHPDTLLTAGDLATSLSRQGKYADAERIQREVLGALTRVLGAEHSGTLGSANNLAQSLSYQGKYAEAEAMQREVLGVQKRVLGAEHPNTLGSANNLAMSLTDQGKYADAEQIQR